MSLDKTLHQNKKSSQTRYQQLSIKIRNIKINDNESLKAVINTVMPEFGASGDGFAIKDPEVQNMYQAYNHKLHIYFVAEQQEKILGGAGIAPLKGGDSKTCELQKMYLLSEARGLGLGKALIESCLSFAKKQGFTKCYIETTEQMLNARKLYEKYGFEPINQQLGNTGHFGCDVYYIKKL